jgi:hypothetical protein
MTGCLFVMAATLGPQCRAEVWSWLLPDPQGNTLLTAAYSPDSDRVVATGFGGSLVSKAGQGGAWTSTRLPTEAVSDVVWTGRDFVATGRGWLGYSANGLDWTSVPRLKKDESYTAVAHGKDTVVVLLRREILVSKDPLRAMWSKKKLPVGKDSYGRTLPMDDIAYGKGLFVVVGPDGSIATSPDALKWTSRTSRTDESLRSVAFNGNIFVAAGDNALLTSSDGINWSLLPEPEKDYPSDYFSYRVIAAGTQLFLKDNSGDGLYRYTGTAGIWEEMPFDQTGWIRGVCPDGANGTYFVGRSGRVARLPAGATALQPEIGTLAGNNAWHDNLQTFAGHLRESFFRADFTDSSGGDGPIMEASYYDKVARQWKPFRETLPGGDLLEPDSFHQTRLGVVAAAGSVFYEQASLGWWRLGAFPSMPSPLRVLCLTVSPSGRVVVVCDEAGAYRIFFSDDWNDWTSPNFPGTLDRDFPAMEKIVHDGRRFILLAERGSLFTSETGEIWSRLPPLPDDPVELLELYGLEDRPLANHIMDFAASGDRIVATTGKWQRADQDDGQERWEIQLSGYFLRFYVYPLPGTKNRWSWVFAPGSGGSVNSWSWMGGTPGDRVMRMDIRPPVLWTGSSFLATPYGSDNYSLESSLESGGAIYTSEDGFDWKLCDLPVYGIQTATWTGSRVAVLAGDGSIATHPTGLSPEVGTESQSVKFRLPKKLYVGRSYAVRPMAKSKLPVNLVVADQDTASLTLSRKGRRWVIMLNILKPGSTTVTAYQSGDRTWKAADPVSISFEAIPAR